MSDDRPRLDQKSLQRLRALIKALQCEGEQDLQIARLVELASGFGGNTGLTVDLDATRDLGQAMVVLRERPRKKIPSWFQRLSKREREVAALLASGLSNQDIADGLFISFSTVKDHVHNILAKSGLNNRAEIAAQWPRDDEPY